MEATFEMVDDNYVVKVSGISVSKSYAATYFEPAEGGDLEYTVDSIIIGDCEGVEYELTDDQKAIWYKHYESKLDELVWAHIEDSRYDC